MLAVIRDFESYVPPGKRNGLFGSISAGNTVLFPEELIFRCESMLVSCAEIFCREKQSYFISFSNSFGKQPENNK